MTELTLTRHNDLIDPLIRVWGWEIPVYLFLGGWVAGMMIIIGYFLLRGRLREDNCVCGLLPAISLVLLSAGMLALFLDLEHKLYVWRLYTTFEITSPMSWGAWILILVYPVLAALFLLRPPKILRGIWPAFDRATALLGRPAWTHALAMLAVVLGVGLGIYTGVLLSALGARPFWNSALLGPLFLVSGLSSAAAFAHLVARARVEREQLATTDNVLLVVELFLLGLFLVGLLSSSQAHADAARLVLGGQFTAVFWVLVVGAGIAVPLLIQVLAVTHRIQHTPLGPILVMAGGLALRFVVVAVGQASHWRPISAGQASRLSLEHSCQIRTHHVGRRLTRIRTWPASGLGWSCWRHSSWSDAGWAPRARSAPSSLPAWTRSRPSMRAASSGWRAGWLAARARSRSGWSSRGLGSSWARCCPACWRGAR